METISDITHALLGGVEMSNRNGSNEKKPV